METLLYLELTIDMKWQQWTFSYAQHWAIHEV